MTYRRHPTRKQLVLFKDNANKRLLKNKATLDNVTNKINEYTKEDGKQVVKRKKILSIIDNVNDLIKRAESTKDRTIRKLKVGRLTVRLKKRQDDYKAFDVRLDNLNKQKDKLEAKIRADEDRLDMLSRVVPYVPKPKNNSKNKSKIEQYKALTIYTLETDKKKSFIEALNESKQKLKDDTDELLQTHIFDKELRGRCLLI